MVDGEVSLRGVHGGIAKYPLARIEVAIGGKSYSVEAAVSENLPMSVLLGRDIPELVEILSAKEGGELTDNVMVVTTRAQRTRAEREAAIQTKREQESGAEPRAIEIVEAGAADASQELPGAEFDAELFMESRERPRLSRSQKCKNNLQFMQEQGPRHPLEMSAGELVQLQEEDDSLGAVRKAARGEVSTAGSGFFRRDGLIYRRWTPPGRDGDEMAVEQLVLPVSCRKAVLELAHEIPLAGHMGRKKTAQRILQRFYWLNVYKDTAEFCKTCKGCQKTAPGRKLAVPLVPLPIIEEPFQRIAMDIVGPLPRSRTGNRYILVICDYATRYPEAIPLRSIDAEHIAEELITVFSRVGVPREILTDQGSNFTSQLLAKIYRMLHIQPIRTSPYHPQTDGLVERFNQTLKAMLRKATSEEGKDWDKLLPYLMFAYREVPQTSTGFSPFEQLYGRQIRGPLDVLKETWEASKRSTESIISYVLSTQEKLAKMSELARGNLAKAQKEQKRWYDQNARERQFQVGDQVLVLLPTSTSKLLAQWHGPHPVLRRLSPVNYEIDMYDKKKRRRILHINMLRKWHTPEALSFLSEEAPEDESEEIPLWKEDPTLRDDRPVISERLDGVQQTQLEGLLKGYKDVLSNQPGRTTLAEHGIETGTASPVRLHPYRLPHAYRETVQRELQEMETDGIIEPSSSDWAAPIVLVKKKDGTLRFCVDYQKLNSVSRVDAYPMPRIDELIDRLG